MSRSRSKQVAYLDDQLPHPGQRLPLEEINQNNKQNKVRNRRNGLVEEELHDEIAESRILDSRCPSDMLFFLLVVARESFLLARA